jgi:HEAT repeat protein
MSGSLLVTQVAKGDALTSVRLEFPKSDAQEIAGEVPVGRLRLFFLKRVADHYTFTDPNYPSTVGAPGPMGEGSANDRVATVMTRVLAAPRTSQEDQIEAMNILGQIPSNVSISSLLGFLGNPSRQLRLGAASNLVLLNDLRGLPSAVSGLLTWESEDGQVAYTILRGIQQLKDPKAVPVVAGLMKAKEKSVREAAIRSLVNIGSRSVIPILGAALTDPAIEVRESAVDGLADLTGQGQWHPSSEKYEANESKYLTYWKDWIRRNPG